MKNFKSELIFTNKVFNGSTVVRKFTFKTVKATRDQSALLVAFKPQLAMGLAFLREQSAHFQRLICFECSSPHKIAA